MRIDANHPLFRAPWVVWHAEECRQLKHVIWVDDGLHQWCQHLLPLKVVGNQIPYVTHQARLIRIDCEASLVIINPVDTSDHVTQEGIQEVDHGTH